MKPDLISAVNALTDQGFGWDGGEDCIVWPEKNIGDPPTQVEIDAKLIELNAEYEAQEYARKRQVEYPATGDQLDYIFHNGVAKWKTDMIEPVKTKWPKDNSGPVESED